MTKNLYDAIFKCLLSLARLNEYKPIGPRIPIQKIKCLILSLVRGAKSVKIKRIELFNIGNHQSSVLEIADDQRLIAITGATGSGKTTLIEAPFLAMYGRSIFRDSNIYSIATRGFIGQCIVGVTLIDKNKKETKIIRSWYQDDNLIGSRHTVSMNGEAIQIDPFKQSIESLFGDLQLIKISNFSSQDQSSFFTLPVTDRKEVLGSLLSPHVFEICDIINQICKDEKKTQKDDLNTLVIKKSFFLDEFQKLKVQAVDVIELNKQLTVLRNRAKLFKDELKKIESKGQDITSSISRIEDAKRERLVLSNKLELLTIENNHIIKQLAETSFSFQPEIDKLKATIPPRLSIDKIAQDTAKIHDEQLKLLGSEKDIGELITEKINRLSRIKKDEEIIQDVPCNPETMARCKFVSNIAKEINCIPTLESEIESHRIALNSLGKELRIINNKLDEFAILLSDTMSIINKIEELEEKEILRLAKDEKRVFLESRMQQIEAEKSEISQKIDKIKIEKVDDLKEQLQKIRDIWKAQEDVYNINENEVRDIEIQLGIIKKNEAELEHYRKALKIINLKIKDLETEITINDLVEQGFSKNGVQAIILQQEINVLESLADEYLKIAFPNDQVSLSLKLQQKQKRSDAMKDTLDPEIEFNDKIFSVQDLSGGQRQALNLAFRAALLTYQAVKNPSNLSFCILDEPTSAVDESISENLIKIPLKLLDFFEQVFIVSYDENLLRVFPDRVLLREINGIAHIERRNNL